MRFARHVVRLFHIVRLLMVLAALTAVAGAQTGRGAITGTVQDAHGAVVKDASVKITEQATGTSRQTTTNSSGVYRIDAVEPGTYNVSIEAKGFAPETVTNAIVEASRTLTLDFNLKIGSASDTVTVEASREQIELNKSEQTRGQNFAPITIENYPLIGADGLTLGQLLPGVLVAGTVNTNTINQNGNFNFTVNGQRPRGNNFMIDGVENNDISVTGPAFTITNPDAVQEVVIQTGDFSAEFGRAGGAIFNQITKGGTNKFHGTATEVYTGSAFQTLNHSDVLAGRTRPPRLIENTPDGTIGGPIILPGYNGRDRSFFFAAVQWDRQFGSTTGNVRVPDAAGIALLNSLAGSCPQAALYLKALGGLVASSANTPVAVSLAVPNAATACNGTTRSGVNLTTGLFGRSESFSSLDANHQIRVDHNLTSKQILTLRWLYDHNIVGPSLNNLPGFDRNGDFKTYTGTASHVYSLNATLTNEFRFNIGRIDFNFPLAATDAFHGTLANYGGLGNGITGFGGATNIPQFRKATNYQYQDTMSKLVGKHTLRFGADFLRQVAIQHPPFNERGSFVYSNSTTGGAVTAFANFLDDFGGRNGSLNRQFGNSIYRPDLFRQSYFAQDSWKATNNLTLNAGVRYENFGTPANFFTVAAFTNYDPINFAAPHKVNGNNTNFGPTVGFAWNPKGEHWFDKMFGAEKTVIRGGFQQSFDTSFNNLLSNIAGSSPNTLGGNILSAQSAGSPRGASGFSLLFAGIAATPADKTSAQSNMLLTPFKTPTTYRWSLGFQRELPAGFVMDSSYVGSVSNHLYRTIDMNPIVNATTGDRLHTELQTSLTPSVRAGQGIRTVRATSANSNYESLQFNLRRSFRETPLGRAQFSGSYTYSHYLDDISDVFSFDSFASSFQSVSQVLGASPHIDYGNSDFDRRHVGVLALLWDVKGPKHGVLGQVLGGWQLSGISRWQTGFPYTIANGTDRNGDGQSGPDRPDISNPNAPLNTRAILNTTCATGYANPDVTGSPCVDPSTVHWIEGAGLPNARTVGRNTLRAPGIDNLDLSIAKHFKITEGSSLEYRLDMFNALNTINFGLRVAPRTVNNSANFLDILQTESIGRSMRMRVKFSF
jgi:outer membrane receptor protein involved in Fe transport